MTHEDFQVDGECTELHAIKCFCIIKSEGDPDFFFTIAPAEENLAAEETEFVPKKSRTWFSAALLSPMTYISHRILSKLMMTMNLHLKICLRKDKATH
jgi:hypothetical protein